MNMYNINPSKALVEPTHGRVGALAEVFLLLACQADASQIKFATKGESLRIAEVIDGTLYEFPQPPDCLRAPMLEQLRRIFSMSDEQSQAECELCLQCSTAYVEIEFRNGGAVVAITRNFESRTAIEQVLHRFWRDNAASQGFFVLAQYYVMDALRLLSMRRTRRSTQVAERPLPDGKY
jgi:hypothetical protein